MSDWDRYASDTYEMLIASESGGGGAGGEDDDEEDEDEDLVAPSTEVEPLAEKSAPAGETTKELSTGAATAQTTTSGTAATPTEAKTSESA